jgi:hypothetical protein
MVSGVPGKGHEPEYPGNPFFDEILLHETTRRVADRLSEGSDPSRGPWNDLSQEERANLTSWVRLVLISERESYGRAMQRAGYEVVDDK